MKKFVLIILSIFSLLCFSFNQINARSVADFTPAIDKKVAKMKTTQEKVDFLQMFSDLLANPKFTQDKNAWLFEDLREYTLNMLNVFQHQLKEEKAKAETKNTSKSSKSTSTTKTSYSSKSSIKLPDLSDNFSNIDEQKVRDAILSWHNDERDSL